MQDVAELAEVSSQTVSRVLNDKSNVSEATRVKVLEAIESLGYRRNTAAVALVTQSSKVLGVIDCGMTQTGPYETIRSVHRAAHEAGYFVSFGHAPSLSAARVRAVIDSLLEQAVEGIVFVAPHYEALSVIADLKVAVPVVVVAPSSRLQNYTVEVNNEAAIQLALNHLKELGHQRMVHLAGPLDWVEANARMETWYRLVQRASLPILPTYVGDWSARSGYELTDKIIKETDPTAIFTANDQMALGVLRRLADLGLTVPDDVSVIGFGDSADAEFYRPGLTTIREDSAKVAQNAIKLLLDLLNDVPRKRATLIEPDLVVRDSVSPPKRTGRG